MAIHAYRLYVARTVALVADGDGVSLLVESAQGDIEIALDESQATAVMLYIADAFCERWAAAADGE